MQNAALYGTIPGLSLVIAEFSANVVTLTGLRQSLADDPAANASKSSLRVSLEKLVRQISVRFTTYSSIKKLDELRKQVRFTPSAIKTMTDEELLDASRNLHAKAEAQLADMIGPKSRKYSNSITRGLCISPKGSGTKY